MKLIRTSSPISQPAIWRAIPMLLAATMIPQPLASAQGFRPNYDESKIPQYQLPDPLIAESGEQVTDASQWPERRAEILEMFTQHVFGRMPDNRRVTCEVVRQDTSANSGRTVRTELSVIVKSPRSSSAQPGEAEKAAGEAQKADGEAERASSNETTERGSEDEKSIEIHVLVDVPKRAHADVADSSSAAGARAPAAVPAFLGLNFQGNHSVTSDEEVRITQSWMRDRKDKTTDGNVASVAGRGVAASRWPVEMINDRGYALITAYYGDIDPDFDDGFINGVHGLMPEFIASLPAEQRPGSIAAWTYGLSCILDAIENTPSLGIDISQVAVIGHSRLGKTALWAGATDPRFALVVSNDSGCGGAALSRRAVGETVGRINASFPHWFCDGFEKYNQNENSLPIDSHELIALAAPRPIAVGSATEDVWADPHGEFLAAREASPVYELLGLPGLLDDEGQLPGEPPTADHPYSDGAISYHLRTGKHDLTSQDWQYYLDFADRFMKQNRASLQSGE